MPQPTLHERFRRGAPTRGPEEQHSWLTAEERRFILWALKDQWPATRIGRALHIHEATVRRFRRQYWDNPRLILELGLYEMAGRALEQEYRCLVCSDRVVNRPDVERHVLGHYLEESLAIAAIPIPVEPPKRRKGRQSPENPRGNA